MRSKKIQLAYFIVAALIISSIACSNGNSVVSPAVENTSGISQELPIASADGNSNRSLLAVYDAVIDPAAKTFTIEPSRDLAYHASVAGLYPNVLTITDYGWSPNFWVDIKLTHPLPNSGIIVFDPRVIAILPANPGVSFNYPTLNCVGNNSVVLEPDGYTKLHDSIGGSIPGNTNPFKAYFKDQPNRRWMDTGVTSETQRWQMNLSGMPIPMQYKLVVDVSTNYPQLPTPGADNASEPVEIEATVGHGLTQLGGDAEITVALLDWQGRMGVGGVQIEAPDLFNGTVSLAYSEPGPNPHEYIYTGTIANSLLAPAGEYKMLVAAWDQKTGIYIYDEFTVQVIYLSMQGNLIWAKRAGGESRNYGDARSIAITSLSDNSTVITGYFQGEAVFGLDEPNETVLNAPGGDTDICIARYNPDGTLLWVKNAGGPDDDYGQAITTLSDDSIVVTGYFDDTAIFGRGEPNETALTTTGGLWDWDIFIARYNPDGSLLWAKRAGGIGSDGDRGYGITTLSDNSVVITGKFLGSATFGPGEPNETILNTNVYDEIFIARYNSNGMLLWAKRAGGSDDDCGYAVTALSFDSVVVTGYFQGTATFGQDELNETVLWSTGDSDIFIARYNYAGMLEWAKGVGGGGNFSDNFGKAITALSDNSTIVTGGFTYTATFGAGEPNQTTLHSAGAKDFFFARYNPDGTLEWAKRVGGDSQDFGSGITTRSDDSIVVTGVFWTAATFGPGEPNQTTLSTYGQSDIFIAEYNSNGILSWVKQAGGSNSEVSTGITTLSNDSTVATGIITGTTTFGPFEPNETTLICSGYYNLFVARFDP
jgi:uncharacterized delta-60 repeat protein